MAATTQSVLESLHRSVPDAMAREYERFVEVIGTDDAREGLEAFREKREPAYRGT